MEELNDLHSPVFKTLHDEGKTLPLASRAWKHGRREDRRGKAVRSEKVEETDVDVSFSQKHQAGFEPLGLQKVLKKVFILYIPSKDKLN